MASSNPTDTGLSQQIKINTAYESFKHNASLAMLVLAPTLVLIPPRKLDLYTLALAGAFVASTNQLTVERTGKGLISQFGYVRAPLGDTDIQKQLLEESARHRLLEEKASIPDEVLRRSTRSKGSLEEKAKELWMGGETEDWKQKRLKEEQEKLDKGEGYGGMIMDQIWEVWTWGEKKTEQLKEKDEKVVEQRKKEQEPKKGA